ncbi:hypothetical protein Vretifemale_15770, partial [Volvox reticuliferus]
MAKSQRSHHQVVCNTASLQLLLWAIVLFAFLGRTSALSVNLAPSSQQIVASSYTTWSKPSYAADGNDQTVFHSAYPGDVGSGSANDFTPFVGLQLAQLSTINKIVILNRLGAEDRLQNAEVRIGTNSITNSSSVGRNALVWKQTATQGAVIEINLNPPVTGLWVSLQNFNPATTYVPSKGYQFVLDIFDIQVL